MFNAPRQGARYSTHFVGSFVDENPLSNSAAAAGYDGLDPWSAAPSPVHTPPPPAVPPIFSSVIGDATAPPIYNKAFQAVDPSFVGEVSVSALSRVLATAALPAATLDRIVNLVSSRPRVSKLEFFIALALAALAQSGKDLSIEQVAALAAKNSLPVPALDLDTLGAPSVLPRAPQYTSDDPWRAGTANGPGSVLSLAGGGLPAEWWTRQAAATVDALGQVGFLLRRHMVYAITTPRGPPVERRYSEFVYLWDCLVRRYPFRILPPLPPKRLGPDANFLEQRRRGLARWLGFVMNHPVMKEDGILSVFLTERSFEEWRRHASVSLEEEGVLKRIDRVEEMTIPSDLEEKLKLVRGKLQVLIEQWQRICVIGERMAKRRESGAGDLARLKMTLDAVVEGSGECWRGGECEMCAGTRTGLSAVAGHMQVASDLLEQRSRVVMLNLVEALKSQRDIYVGMRDLFWRHERQSGDDVERIKKRIEGTSLRLESIKSGQKEGWAEESDRLMGMIERDQASIGVLLARRVFIRNCMWHELRVVLHNRENTLIVQALQVFAREERGFGQGIVENWVRMSEAMEEISLEY